MPVHLAVESGTAVITCEGELDTAQPHLLAAVQQVLGDGVRRIVVDLVEVTFIDSSVVRALLIAIGGTIDQGGWVRIAYERPIIGKVLRICGLGDVLPQYRSVADALAGTVGDAPSRAERA